MKKALAFFASVTLLLSMMLPTSVYAKPDYPDISATEKTLIEAESIVDTKYGDGTSTWANLENKIMFYGGGGASAGFYAGTNGDNYLWGEPDATHFKLRTTSRILRNPCLCMP